MLISDWSSDVCSSDLTGEVRALARQLYERAADVQNNRRQYAADCHVDRDATSLRFRCEAVPDDGGTQLAGRLTLEGSRVGSGVVDGLAIDGSEALNRLTVTPGSALDPHGVELQLRDRGRHETGKASCRERGCQYV